jgi:hypothetical protein
LLSCLLPSAPAINDIDDMAVAASILLIACRIALIPVALAAYCCYKTKSRFRLG